MLHIAFNMYALYLFGPFVERALGTWRFIAAYLTMAVVSSVFVYCALEPRGTLTIGASGAIFGLFGMALVLLLKAKQDVRSLLVLLAINAFISTQGNISWQGHLGGFIVGVRARRRPSPTPRGTASTLDPGRASSRPCGSASSWPSSYGPASSPVSPQV